MNSHCGYCSMQCGLELAPGSAEGGYVIRPSPDFPVATGRLCQKGLHALAHTIHPSRILSPLKRILKEEKGKRHWVESTWDKALDSIAAKIMSLQSQYGNDSIAVYGGGALTNEVCYLLGKFTRVALRSRYIDHSGTYGMSSGAAASQQAFGLDRGLTMPLEEILRARYIILAGTNIAECQPTMLPYLLEAKKKGAVIVTVDPRNTLTSKISSLHVRLQPGFDSVFVNGLIHVILDEMLYDEAFVTDHTIGLSELREATKSFPPARVEEITGIFEGVTRTIARQFARSTTGIVLTARGIEQQVNGVEHALNYMNLVLLTGKIGRTGCGFGTVTGQANGQGGREQGQTADQLPGYRSIEDPMARKHVAEVWGIEPEELPGKGVTSYEMFEKIERGDIRAMIVLGSNPIVSSPNNLIAERALSKLELLVVIDLFETETASFADWILPGASFLEGEGTVTNVEGRVLHRSQALPSPGNSKPDYQIVCELAHKLGKGNYFQFQSPEEVFDELCRASEGGIADYSGVSYERLKAEKGLFWPCPSPTHPGTPIVFAGGMFAHEDCKARLSAIQPGKPAETTDELFPYLLSTGRVGSHFSTGVLTRRTKEMNRKAPVPLAEIHPTLAFRIGLRPTSRIRITSRRGSQVFPIKITESIHPTTVFVPFHWGGDLSVNKLTHDALHPISGMPEFKICAVQVERVDELD